MSQGWYIGRDVAVGILTNLWHKLQASGIGRQKRPRRTMQVSQGWYNGRDVAVGSLIDLWHKLQASNRDRQAEEAKVDNAGESRVM